jgi:hypothetical protein
LKINKQEIKLIYNFSTIKTIIMFNIWGTEPLARELLNISRTASAQRRPSVEAQYDSVQAALVKHLRELAHKYPDILTQTIRLDDLFGTNLYQHNIGIATFTPLGSQFKLAMNDIEPPYPTSKEKNWIGSRLVGYLSSQGLLAKYSYETLTVSWDETQISGEISAENVNNKIV